MIWPNRHCGEVVGHINAKRRVLRLSLSALAQLEACYDDTDILLLLRRFSENGLRAQDVMNILRAGLAGAGDPSAVEDAPLDVTGGYGVALELATELIERAFNQVADMPPPPDAS